MASSVSLGSLCRLPTAVARFTHSSPLASRLVPTVGRPTVGRESRERRVAGGERGMTKGETDRYAPSHVHRSSLFIPVTSLPSFISSPEPQATPFHRRCRPFGRSETGPCGARMQKEHDEERTVLPSLQRSLRCLRPLRRKDGPS